MLTDFVNQLGDPHSSGVVPIAVRLRTACRLLGCGKTKLREKIAAGELESYRDGTTMITTRSLVGYVERRLAAAKVAKALQPEAVGR